MNVSASQAFQRMEIPVSVMVLSLETSVKDVLRSQTLYGTMEFADATTGTPMLMVFAQL